MKIILEDYQTGWVDAFDAEKEVIASVLTGFNPTIEHIGSTAIEGLCAKPTIDILVGLQDEPLLDTASRQWSKRATPASRSMSPPCLTGGSLQN